MTDYKTLLQLGLLAIFWLAGEALVQLGKLPLPGSVPGLALVLLLLLTKRLNLLHIKQGADRLIGDMLLFFIPAILALLDHKEFLGLLGLKILVVILLSTVAVMLVTAFVVDHCYHWRIIHAHDD